MELDSLKPADAIILAVAHDCYVDGGWPLVQRLLNKGSGLVLDVKMKLRSRLEAIRHRALTALKRREDG